MNKKCIEISDKIISITGLDIFHNTRKQEYVQLRALVCYILREKMHLRWTSIANFFTSMGKKTDHATVIHLVNMYPLYKKDSLDLEELESLFVFKDEDNFDELDRINFLKGKVKLLTEKNKDLKRKIKFMPNPKNGSSVVNLFYDILKDIPEDKVNDVIKRIELFKKSWSWKNKDKCQVIESSTSMDGMHW